MASTALALPGAQLVVVPPAPAGLEKLEPRFLTLFQECHVPDPVILKFAAADCCEISVYGNIGSDKKDVEGVLQAVVDVDPTQRPADFILRAKLLTVWEACRTRMDVENKDNAERHISNLPPRITPDEYEMTKRPFEASQGYQPGTNPRHLMPSKPFFERLISQVQTL